MKALQPHSAITRASVFTAAIFASAFLPINNMTASAADIKVDIASEPDSGMSVVTVKVGDTVAKLCPEAGANLYSLVYKGREILKTPAALKDLPGFMYGNPVLYPTPNRVRGAVMKYDGQTYKFPDNNKGNFLHGLVHSVDWKMGEVQTFDKNGVGEVLIPLSIEFAPGTERYDLFPFQHTFKLNITIRDAAVRFEYIVDNAAGKKAVPYGVAFHPWFLDFGKRDQVTLTIPCTHVYESVNLLPTGKLLSLDGSKYDCRSGRNLGGWSVDDVWYGLKPSAPATIDWADAKLRLTLEATEDFKTMVVFTEQEKWFCVENQTCSTDAHNLAEQGKNDIANLLTVAPGQSRSGAVEFKLSALAEAAKPGKARTTEAKTESAD